MATGWFALAVHALALLARSDEGYPSAFIAGSVNTHAVFLRKVLAHLVRAGILEAREGRDGGYKLARPANQITLADVYRAMESEEPIAPCPSVPNPLCPIGSGMTAAMGEVATEVEASVLQVLAGRTIADVSNRAVEAGRKG